MSVEINDPSPPERISVTQPYTTSKTAAVHIEFTLEHGLSPQDKFTFLGALTSNVGELYDIEKVTIQFRTKHQGQYLRLTHIIDVDVVNNAAVFALGDFIPLPDAQEPYVDLALMASVTFRDYPKNGFDEARFVYTPHDQNHFPEFFTFPLNIATTFSPKVYFDGMYQSGDETLSDILLITDAITLPAEESLVGIDLELTGYSHFTTKADGSEAPYCLLNNILMAVNLVNPYQVRLSFLDGNLSLPARISLSLRCAFIYVSRTQLEDVKPIEADYISITLLSTQIAHTTREIGSTDVKTMGHINTEMTNHAMSRKIFYVVDHPPWMVSSTLIEDDAVYCSFTIYNLLAESPQREFRLSSTGIDMSQGLARVVIHEPTPDGVITEDMVYSSQQFDGPAHPTDGKFYPALPFNPQPPPGASKSVQVAYIIKRAKATPEPVSGMPLLQSGNPSEVTGLATAFHIQFRLDLLQPNPQDDLFIYTDIAKNDVRKPFGPISLDVVTQRGEPNLFTFNLNMTLTQSMSTITMNLPSNDYAFTGDPTSCRFDHDKKTPISSIKLIGPYSLGWANIYPKGTSLILKCDKLHVKKAISQPFTHHVPFQVVGTLQGVTQPISSTQYFSITTPKRNDHSVKGITLLVIIISTAIMGGVCVLSYFVFLCIKRRRMVSDLETSLLDQHHSDAILVN